MSSKKKIPVIVENGKIFGSGKYETPEDIVNMHTADEIRRSLKDNPNIPDELKESARTKDERAKLLFDEANVRAAAKKAEKLKKDAAAASKELKEAKAASKKAETELRRAQNNRNKQARKPAAELEDDGSYRKRICYEREEVSNGVTRYVREIRQSEVVGSVNRNAGRSIDNVSEKPKKTNKPKPRCSSPRSSMAIVPAGRGRGRGRQVSGSWSVSECSSSSTSESSRCDYYNQRS